MYSSRGGADLNEVWKTNKVSPMTSVSAPQRATVEVAKAGLEHPLPPPPHKQNNSNPYQKAPTESFLAPGPPYWYPGPTSPGPLIPFQTPQTQAQAWDIWFNHPRYTLREGFGPASIPQEIPQWVWLVIVLLVLIAGITTGFCIARSMSK